ncbi:hypothetical protein HQN89_10775 [Paenibacillus frigoriresistens]|uniref:hypothetical protein n=1 Tax=Paenibacillus alginolyticus TaxID=59839 RepID=UPI00156695E5|nr:hypothetical protein [Paenibacillus frigoriresistens]NRF91503.1 hypothetical protein [Paenibacillus frigoriresistens]
MNWKQASLSQLYEIGFHDTGCALIHKQAAKEEIRRRKQSQSHRNTTQTKIRRKRA